MSSDTSVRRSSYARARSFELVDFVHENRLSNYDAHNVARSNVIAEPAGRHVWLLSPPEGVSNILNQLCH